jgi:hypothetical protein
MFDVGHLRGAAPANPPHHSLYFVPEEKCSWLTATRGTIGIKTYYLADGSAMHPISTSDLWLTDQVDYRRYRLRKGKAALRSEETKGLTFEFPIRRVKPTKTSQANNIQCSAARTKQPITETQECSFN